MPTVLQSTLNVQGVTLHILCIKDRRGRRPHRDTRWLFARQLELLLWGGNSGALAAMLARLSMSASTMTLTRASIGPLVTEREFEQVLDLFKTLLPAEGRNKVRNLSLLPTTVAVAAVGHFGRNEASVDLLRALNSLPARWEQELQREADEDGGEVDLVLLQQLEEDEDIEKLELDLGSELLLTELPYKASEQCEAKVANLALSPVPPILETEFKQYESFRNAPFNRFRTGASVVSTTIESDRSNALRWLGYVTTQFGQAPTVKLFASPRVAEWTEHWMTHLRSLGLKASTLAVYCNGVISVSSFALTLVEEPDSCPVDQLCNLRRQAESLAKGDRLFETVSKNWISWLDAQKARQEAVKLFYAETNKYMKGILLRECMLLAFLTLQPPDRVGVVRRLRLGNTLYKTKGEELYTVNLSTLRHKVRVCACGLLGSPPPPHPPPSLSHPHTHIPTPQLAPQLVALHPPRRQQARCRVAASRSSTSIRPLTHPPQTSRFYGPQVSSLPKGIGEWVQKYEESITFEFTGDNPYLFSLASDWQRGMSSSQWCSFVKGVFHKFAGVSTPPKLLRAAFCTHLRSAEGVDEELLASAAHAMKHQVATGGSGARARHLHDTP